MDPSGFVSSQRTPEGSKTAKRMRSAVALVCPGHFKTPPGRQRSSGTAFKDTAAETPVVIPDAAPMETVKAVPGGDVRPALRFFDRHFVKPPVKPTSKT